MNLCITGGGTGGHLSVADALCQAAVKRGHNVIFIGSTHGQDQAWFGQSTLFSSVYFLDTAGVVNKNKLGKLKALLKIFSAMLRARGLLKQHKIDAVMSVGGFSAAAASLASLTMRKPLFIHEQNAVAGSLNRLLKPYAKRFISAYEKDCEIKGYPVKEEFFQRAHIREKLGTIIFLGGSQGAAAINNLALGVAKTLDAKGIKIIHQCGEKEYERVKAEYEKMGIAVELYPFSKELAQLVSKADMAVSRAGASTLWELCANGIVTFFVPYPYAAGDHQFYNAEFVVKEQMGWCEREAEQLEQKLLAVLDEPLSQKSQKLMQYANKNVADSIITLLERSV
jgi:UDP-N-acetylglucosamine--N-acetylmuramyl-(pentapeptide) pyrophosphoryl-undecaprenol N-acetylglucosamine transferase